MRHAWSGYVTGTADPVKARVAVLAERLPAYMVSRRR